MGDFIPWLPLNSSECALHKRLKCAVPSWRGVAPCRIERSTSHTFFVEGFTAPPDLKNPTPAPLKAPSLSFFRHRKKSELPYKLGLCLPQHSLFLHPIEQTTACLAIWRRSPCPWVPSLARINGKQNLCPPFLPPEMMNLLVSPQSYPIMVIDTVYAKRQD